MSSPDKLPSYKPGVFYFRRRLRDSKNHATALEVAHVVCTECEKLQSWAVKQDVVTADDLSLAYLKQAIETSTSLRQAIILGLFACHELEKIKAAVRAHDLIPPKWMIDREEAKDKGWPTASSDE